MLTASRTLDTLADGTLPGECPQLPASTWAFDVVGHVELAGDALAEREYNLDLAKGLLDPSAGFVTQDEIDDERVYADALALARLGGERVYEQEQGFAPLVLEPQLWKSRDGELYPNGDAFVAAFEELRSHSTDIDMPQLSRRRRHWRDMGPEEQRGLSFAFEAESHGLVDPDALAGHVNASLPGRDGLDDVTVEELEELLGEQGAADYLAHLFEMAEHQLALLEREREHARRVASANPVARAVTSDGRTVSVFLRRTKRSDRSYAANTGPWRSRNELRRAMWAKRSVVPEPQPGVLPGRLDIPEDPRWRRVHGPVIVDYLKQWYPSLEYGSDAWKVAARRVYLALKQARSPLPAPSAWRPDVEVERFRSPAVVVRSSLPPSECVCTSAKHECCPVHPKDRAPRSVARERYEARRQALEAEIAAERWLR